MLPKEWEQISDHLFVTIKVSTTHLKYAYTTPEENNQNTIIVHIRQNKMFGKQYMSFITF